MKNEYASCPSIYENILRKKNELHVKVLELQTENNDLKICLKRFTDVASTLMILMCRIRLIESDQVMPGYHLTDNRLEGCHPTSTKIIIFILIHITTILAI